MTNPAHIAETALLLLAAYLLGCILGYGIRHILHAGRGTRQVAAQATPVVAAPVASSRPRSPAARLAASVEDLPKPAPVTIKPAVAKPTPAPAPAPAVAASNIKKTPTAPKAKPRGKPSATDPKPATLAAPRDGQGDNLTQIKGIGLKIQASLQAIGIYHLDQIGGWNRANVDWVDTQLALKGRIRRERWVEQAQELARLRVSA